MKIYVILFIFIASSIVSHAQKRISQEEIRRQQEALKRANDELQRISTTNFSTQKPITYIPEYQDELAIQFDISIAQFMDFQGFLDSRKAAQIPFLYKDLSGLQAMGIPYERNISTKGYPYYGKLSIKLRDSQGNEFDSYGYVYDTEKIFDGVDDYKIRDFKATVQRTSTTNIYDIYCDGKKIISKQYTTAQRSVTNYESKMDGMGLLGTVLQIFAVAYLEKAEIEGFEGELYKVAQQKACFYEEDFMKKFKDNSLAFFKEAQVALEKKNFNEAMRKLDASIWAENNVEALELRSDIFSRFNSIPNAFKDYLTAIQLAKGIGDKEKLGILYRKVAILLASLKQATDFRMDDAKVLTLFPETAIDYIKKAAENGDNLSKKLLGEINTPEILQKIKNLKQL